MYNRLAALETLKQQGARLAHKLGGGDQHRVAEELHRGVHATEEKISQHPGIALGIALSIGVVLGWLLKRR
jgi:ElaB/YqjD/DUF883 family membrane-anchored ribosome-binding protein